MLPKVNFVINNIVNTTTQFCPNELLLGYRPLSMYDTSLREEDRIEVCLGDLKLNSKQEFAKLLATEMRDQQNHKLNKLRCDKSEEFSENEKVLVKNVFKKSKFDKEFLLGVVEKVLD
uniref:Uncharacterized protein n=2 Tax=Strongyloides stercoralis TaxID=6248 RepID=A0AAF5DJS2_STRER